MAKINNADHLLSSGCNFVFKTSNLDFIIRILLYLQLFLSVKQVRYFATINFEETHVKLCASWC